LTVDAFVRFIPIIQYDIQLLMHMERIFSINYTLRGGEI